ncbi:hypothetical protein [Mobiluncus mulieris]|uniref:Uncharacterized protein n=1 Tax=Mobiluncus mulieris TaxID=2052 RepID=A0A7Y0YHV9_9ACTO|nr:hypothetical protein [Mobiluncus mulieris]NMX03417.1 hypothetical protein [Mobiluncus mulieris]
MAEYQPLRLLLHRTTCDAHAVLQAELQQRLAFPAALRYPYQAGKYPLFVVPHRGIQELCEAVLRQELVVQRLWNQLPGVAQGHYYLPCWSMKSNRRTRLRIFILRAKRLLRRWRLPDAKTGQPTGEHRSDLWKWRTPFGFSLRMPSLNATVSRKRFRNCSSFRIYLSVNRIA